MTGVTFVLGNDDAGPPPDIGLAFRTRWALDKELRTGLRVLAVACVLGGGWFFFMPLAGAVVVPGNLVVQSNVKTIQHPTGGVVADIRVANGTRVKAGDLLVRLDATQARASLQVVSKQLDELRARIARLAAERDGRARIEFPDELAARSSDGTVQTLLASEDTLFKARASARQSQRELQQGRIAQLTEEISGLETQVASRAKQLELIQGELGGVQDLYDKHLVPLARLTALQREAARIDGERGQLVSSIAETKSKIGEAELQIVRLDQDFRSEVVKDIGEAQGKDAELTERAVAARDLLDRIEIRSPTSGLVHQLAAHTIGGVIRPGDAIMEIVPDTEDLQIEARLQPQDIDHVHPGQAGLRPLLGLQPAHDATAHRLGVLCVGRHQPRSADQRALLHRSRRAARRRAPPARRPTTCSWDASGSIHADRQQDDDELSVQADRRPDASRFCRAMIVSRAWPKPSHSLRNGRSLPTPGGGSR